jgi:hypothetical protein
MENRRSPKFLIPIVGVAAALVIGLAVWFLRGNNSEPSPKPDIYFYIDGTWVNEHGFSVTINSKEHTYRGTALGETFNQDYQLKGFHDNVIVFESKGHRFVAQFNSPDEMTLTKESSGVPVVVKRLKTTAQ